MDEKVAHWYVWYVCTVSQEIKRTLYERVAIPTVSYSSETWLLSVQERRKLEVYEMMWLRSEIARHFLIR